MQEINPQLIDTARRTIDKVHTIAASGQPVQRDSIDEFMQNLSGYKNAIEDLKETKGYLSEQEEENYRRISQILEILSPYEQLKEQQRLHGVESTKSSSPTHTSSQPPLHTRGGAVTSAVAAPVFEPENIAEQFEGLASVMQAIDELTNGKGRDDAQALRKLDEFMEAQGIEGGLDGAAGSENIKDGKFLSSDASYELAPAVLAAIKEAANDNEVTNEELQNIAKSMQGKIEMSEDVIAANDTGYDAGLQSQVRQQIKDVGASLG